MTHVKFSNGKIPVPDEVRRRLGLRPGDEIEFVFDGGTGVRLQPKGRRLTDLLGALREPDRPSSTVEEMHEALLDVAGEDWDRIRTQKNE